MNVRRKRGPKNRRTNGNKRQRGGATFMCPRCNSISRVTRTTRFADGIVIRERKCLKRGHIFETEERMPRKAPRRKVA